MAAVQLPKMFDAAGTEWLAPPAAAEPTRFFIGADEWNGASKLMEEAGEVVQVLGKLIGSKGDPAHFDGSDLRERLVEEIGDLLGAVRFFLRSNDIPNEAIVDRAIAKERLFNQWNAAERAR